MYSAVKKPNGNYEIYKDGKLIGTGTASTLSNYGLSENNLSGAGTPVYSYSPYSNTTSSSSANVPYYGKTKNSDWEEPALQQETWAVSAAQQSGLVDPNYLATITSDPGKISFYVNALAYGGYTIGDVLNDIKRGEMVANGDEQAKNIKLIDPEITKSAYQLTPDGQRSYREAATVIPTYQLAGNLNPDILKYGSNMPDELFKTLVPLLDNTSQEFKDAVSEVKSAFYDLANQQLQATSEQEKAVADYNYSKFKEDIKKNYGIVLSDDAMKAWSQIEDLENTFSTRGISGSGLENEVIDDVLQSTRKTDQRLRQEKLSKEEAQMASVYTSSATPEQIKALIDEDIAKGLPKSEWRATKWGLVPSDDVLAKYNLETLKTMYPDQSEEELKAYRDSVLDENGNYRSSIYSKYYNDVAKNKASKKSTAETQVLQSALNKETSAYKAYDQSEPYSGATTGQNTQMTTDAEETPNPPKQPESIPETPATPETPPKTPATPETTPKTQSPDYQSIQTQLDAAKKAAGDIQKGIDSLKVKNTSTTNPITPTITAPTTTTPTTKKSYNTLYDYYVGTAGKYNTWNSAERQADAKRAGIKNYTGAADQNIALLKYLSSQ